MGDRPGIEPFTALDSFLRTIDRKRYVKDGVVQWEVFMCRKNEPSLSFTFRDAALTTDEGLDRFRRIRELPLGGFPGICFLTCEDLVEKLRPPLRPRHTIRREDPHFGDLHCSTDCPMDEGHAEAMANLASENGVLCIYKRK